MINVAIKAARSAGNIINRASLNLERLQVARKQQNDFVTEVDQAAENAIIEVLREAYPTHHILAEEIGYLNGLGESLGPLTFTQAMQQATPGQDHYLWVIDPLDGTTNFIHGFPQFAVSRRWTISFLFGLVHGFGFSSVLKEIGLPKDSLLLSLLNFNLGVEAGQLVAVLIIVPLLIQLRKTQWEEKTIRALSAIVLVVGLALFVERVVVGG
jgi:hypothetical protein